VAQAGIATGPLELVADGFTSNGHMLGFLAF
jgi:hypothetical protein